MNLPSHLTGHFKNRFEITGADAVGGGCINDCYQLETSQGPYFIKLNNAAAFPGMFEVEAKGLALLASTHTIIVPKVIETGEVDGTSFLLLEHLQPGTKRNTTMYDLGKKLAALHRNTNTSFGLDHDNYIGSLPQRNEPKSTWAEFFVEMRLKPQLSMADALFSSSTLDDFEKLFSKLDSMFPVEPPALLHGDLWNGNYLVNDKGEACLVVPAIYYGHREMDIAMTQLFGGFDNSFYEGYNDAYPLQSDWRKRVHLYNLYPLLVHVNLFGAGYVEQVTRCLRKFV